ncbi:hypothetical protein KXS13_23185 [Yokenella regensburgei]|uniref:hypothetical protein n=2 Tax=Yokenella regensburgei TaxID=158877 RepID=UPI003F14B532
MVYYRFLLKTAALFLLLLVSRTALAGCTANAKDYTLTLPANSFTVGSNVQPNTALGPVITFNPGAADAGYFVCTGSRLAYFVKYASVMEPSGFEGIYKTKIPGIGVKITTTLSYIRTVTESVGNIEKRLIIVLGQTYNTITFRQITVQFYVIGPVTQYGKMDLSDFVVQGWINNDQYSPVITDGAVFNNITFAASAIQYACLV